MPPSPHVLHASMEHAPFVKAGGLADVVAALPAALARARRGLVASVVLPWHAAVEPAATRHVLRGTARAGRDLPYEVVLAEGLEAPHPVFLVDHEVFRGARLYEGAREAEKLAVLGHAAAQLARHPGALAAVALPRVSLVHVHDFHPALACVHLKHGAGRHVPSVATVHNARYQSWLDWSTADALGLPAGMPRGDADHDGRFTVLKAGILSAGWVTTVSPTHAAELAARPEASHGLDYAFRLLGGRFTGILNGIDARTWDPSADPFLERPFDARDLSGKARTKAATCHEHGLDPELPLLAFIGRLVSEKGLDVLLEALPRLARDCPDAQVIVLGTGEPRYHDALARASRAGGSRVRSALRHDEALAHRLHAAADALLMPSWHEPCGLSQMYAMRYGSVPIVFPAGGLRDSVEPFDPRSGRGTGAWMERHDAAALVEAVGRVLSWRRDPATWSRVRANAMATDLSWDAAAARYVEVYDRAGIRA